MNQVLNDQYIDHNDYQVQNDHHNHVSKIDHAHNDYNLYHDHMHKMHQDH